MATAVQRREVNPLPTEPCLRPALKSLVVDATSLRFPSDGRDSYSVFDHSWKPPSPPKSLVPEIRDALAEHERYMEPAPRQKISARVTVLLAHYYVPDLPAAAQVAVLEDWVEALRDFPWWAIKTACDEWLRTQRRKPVPADLVDLCNDAMRDARHDLWALRRLVARHEDLPRPAPTREREQQRAIHEEANRKRSDAAKGRERADDGTLASDRTNSAATGDAHSDKGREAKATASGTNRGSVEPPGGTSMATPLGRGG